MALPLNCCQISPSSQGGDGVERGGERGEIPDSCRESTKGSEGDGDLRHEEQGQDVEKMPTAARADQGAGGRVGGRRNRDEGRLGDILVFARPEQEFVQQAARIGTS